ncbi:hypothetical protein R533_05295 [Salmonella enterica subsp. houtenae serovar 40:z4,z32:-]|uniref:Tail fiber assembly protein n=1 Tax=Salmonella enterica TaxID=28901 RepID=A0ACC5L699_SALER|nr:tail fiber assembly protein [Salmonella enterica]OSD46523.1 hypothetical protein R533_05295 [Salmonella enterica subsp. houtenae serovar 40:z4,z32:-]MBA3142018.1 tail fiber assembly protein [Salmonella enterica]MBA3213985.1 tail fiber assembly protein [Salmonella enterica]OSD80658.1 hypothetical protein R529_03155 [Salmonella enterica subsp. houtenae serovar 40:z4,z32:-]
MAIDEEKVQLDEWKEYRVRVNCVKPSEPVWPEIPA